MHIGENRDRERLGPWGLGALNIRPVPTLPNDKAWCRTAGETQHALVSFGLRPAIFDRIDLCGVATIHKNIPKEHPASQVGSDSSLAYLAALARVCILDLAGCRLKQTLTA